MDKQLKDGQTKGFESKLIPVIREGVEVIKMIFFKKLKDAFLKKYTTRDAIFSGRLAGVIINTLFGSPNQEEPFVTFVRTNREIIDNELKDIAKNFEEMRIPLTDALRIQFLCDNMEGNDSPAVLVRAEELGILLTDRDLPLPHHFIELVRRLGSSFNILSPM